MLLRYYALLNLPSQENIIKYKSWKAILDKVNVHLTNNRYTLIMLVENVNYRLQSGAMTWFHRMIGPLVSKMGNKLFNLLGM